VCGQEKLLVHDLQEERVPVRADQLHDVVSRVRALSAGRRLKLIKPNTMLLSETVDSKEDSFATPTAARQKMG
jgi:hypothetical protein